MKSVGIFGGSFNPIHTGHIALAKSLCEKAGLDEVWFMVSPMNPFKKAATDLLDDQLRLEMVKKALEGLDGIVSAHSCKLATMSFICPSHPILGIHSKPSVRTFPTSASHY